MTRFSASILTASAALFLFTTSVAAQESAVSPTTQVTPSTKPGKEALKNLRSELRSTMKEQKTGVKEMMRGNREEFKAKLAELKDARKKAAVTRIDSKLAMINTNMTMHMEQVLTRLEMILDKIAEKADAAQAGEADTSTLDQAVTAAKSALAAAQTAVSEQKEKEYVITLTTESAVKQNVGTVVSSLRADLQAVHATVVTAKQAIMKAAMELAKLKVTPTGSTTPTQTVTPSVGAEE